MKKNNLFLKLGVFMLLLIYANSFAQMITRSTAPLFVTFDELKVWTTTGSTASASNVSTVPLATRISDLNAQINPNQSYNLKVDWTVDGVDRWSNYINEVNKFNTYNFINWSYIDKFTWFSNGANGVYIPPKPFIDAAHKNGVKIVGTVIIGNATYYTSLLTNTNGDFPAARKLVEIAKYYGFDGYLFNMEAPTTSANAALLQKLLKQIQSLKTSSMDISWYDSLLTDGNLNWYDQMNSSNVGFMQSAGTVSNSFFSNYNWTPTDITTSVSTANSNGISPFNVYMGNDAWTRNAPNGFLYNKNFMDNYYTSGNLASPKCSAVLYAFGNLIYENMGTNNGNIDFVDLPSDWAKYYDGEAKYFSGDDLNVNTNDTSWKGMGYYMPARSVINTLPFETNFNIGQGKIWSVNGVQTTRDWSDAGKQDILPTWQWSKTGTASINPRIDCDIAYNGGSSLKFTGSISNNSANIKLYLTQLAIAANTKFDVTYKTTAGATNAKLLLYFSGAMSTPVELDLGTAATSNWETKTLDLSSYSGKTLSNIGIKIGSTSTISSYQLNIGKFKIYNQTVITLPSAATIISPSDAQTAVANNVTLNWTAGTNATSHDVYFGTTNPPTFVQNQTGTTYNPGTLAYNTTYYWRIDEKNTGGMTQGKVWSFTTAPQQMPTIVSYTSPSNASINQTLNSTLSWSASANATSYDVYFGTDSAALSLVSNQTTLTYNPQNLANNTTYYWRVDAKNAAGTTQGSVWSFKTSPLLPSATAYTSPANASTNQSLATTLNWSASANATSYDVYFGTSSTTLTLVSNQTSLSYSPQNLANNTTYYWRVDAKNADGTTQGSVWSFTTIPALPSAVSYTSPTNASTSQALTSTLNWSASANSTSYDVYFGTSASALTLASNQTSLSYAPQNLVSSTTYYWRVDAKNAAGTTQGNVYSFTTNAPVSYASTNNAISSTSTSSSINAGNVTQMNAATKLTMEAWAKFNAIGNWDGVLGKALTSQTSRTLVQTTADGRLYLLFGNGTNSYGYTAAGIIKTGTWYHIAVVYDGLQTTNTTRLKLYINGTLQTLTFSGTIPTKTATNTYNFTAGSFNGTIDEVRVWNTALTQANIQTWRNKLVGSCHPNYANLVLYWNLDDASTANTAKACLTTTYNGTITSATYTTSTQATSASGCATAKMITTEVNPSQEFVIYPNPVTNKEYNLKFYSEKDTEGTIYIFDNSGRLINSETFKVNSGLNTITRRLPENIISNNNYYIKVRIDGNIYDKKLMVR